MKRLIACLAIVMFTCCKPKVKAPLYIDVSEAIVSPKHYIIGKTNTALTIDGLANEASWKNAPYTTSFTDIEGIKVPKFKTQAKMLWDDNYLYIYAKMEEPHIWGNLTKKDTIIFFNNDFEIFIDPSNTGFGYGEIEINALNTIWDLYLDKPYRVGGKANSSWDVTGLKSAIFINGTLNNPNDIDHHWSLEVAIPLLPLIALKNKPKSIPKDGEQWRLNFSRVQWDFDVINKRYQRKKINNSFQNEYNWVWSPQKVVNMHEPEKWGFIQFTTQAHSHGVAFIEDNDLLVKQAAYALFRKTRFTDLSYLLERPVGSEINVEVAFTTQQQLSAIFLKTNLGFEYKIKSPITANSYSINEQGILQQL